MKRTFVELDKIDVWSHIHFQTEDGFDVLDIDGKTKQEHLDGIEYFKKRLLKGDKIVPPLVQKVGDRYQELDGFKRILAYKELGIWDTIEVFVAEGKQEMFMGGEKMKPVCGGQTYERFPIPVEGNEGAESDYCIGSCKNLRIELRENIHIHWGERGQYKLSLGKRDFELLAKAFINGASH